MESSRAATALHITSLRIRRCVADPSSTLRGGKYGWRMRRLIRFVLRLGILAAAGAVIKRLVDGSRPAPVTDGWKPAVVDRPTPSPVATSPSPAPDEVESPVEVGDESAAAPRAAPKKAASKTPTAKKPAPRKATAKKSAPKKDAAKSSTAEKSPGTSRPPRDAGTDREARPTDRDPRQPGPGD